MVFTQIIIFKTAPLDVKYTAPTSIMLLELLSSQLGISGMQQQASTEVLWQAVLGVTYQYTAGHLEEEIYSQYCQFLKVNTYILHIYISNNCNKVYFYVYHIIVLLLSYYWYYNIRVNLVILSVLVETVIDLTI